MRLFHNGRKCGTRSRFGAAVLAVMAAGLLLAPAQAQESQTACHDLYFPVSVLGLPQTMYGKLCAPPGARTVEVLVPGGTYNSSYWDIGYTPEIRSFRLAMNKAGFATLAVDRLGTGRSSKPLSALLTASVQAGAVHDVIQALRAGSMGQRFDKVIIGGHSIGSAMAMIEAGTYHDVDGVFETGWTHRMNVTTVAGTLAKMIPQSLDPRLYHRGLDPGYLTTSPGTRYADFHTPGPDIAGAIAYDESTKDVFAATEAVDSLTLNTVIIPISRQINVPVMAVQGDDPNFCGPPLGSNCSSPATLRGPELPFFPSAPSVRAYVLHGYGHAINYAPNAPLYFRALADWVRDITA